MEVQPPIKAIFFDWKGTLEELITIDAHKRGILIPKLHEIGIPMGIVSAFDSEEEFKQNLFSHPKYNEYQQYFTFEQLCNKWRESSIFQHLLTPELDGTIQPNEILMVGDTEGDEIWARENGMQFIGISRRFGPSGYYQPGKALKILQNHFFPKSD